MKISEAWLRDWTNPDFDTETLAHRLTMLGHEVDGVEIAGSGLDGVVVAEVLKVDQHPNADRLSVCRVSTGEGPELEVVCGAPNVQAGMKAALARPGVSLPNGLELVATEIRGVVSNGMLCSPVEVGLGDESDGIIHLPDDAPTGLPLDEFLGLPDAVIDLDLTPNRGDCFSVLGIARDIAALTRDELRSPSRPSPPATTERVQPVELAEPEVCPVFAGRVVEGIDPAARSPLWLVERLRRSGLREISPVVDVTNYVMLELGQPLHGYDLDKLSGSIRPKRANGGESLTLLDEKDVTLHEGTVVITDDSGVIGLAGIMGGLSTAVSDATTNVFFEGAFWPRPCMAGQARSFGLHTDASLRFERGVDPAGQGRAVDRATELLLDIAGGKAGPLVVTESDAHRPVNEPVVLRRSRLQKLLGVDVPDDTVESILESLGFSVTSTKEGWQAVPPSHRFDIEIEADLIEEVARIYGYDSIPQKTATVATPLAAASELQVADDKLAATLVARDFQEVITYTFVDESANTLISGSPTPLVLSNPISSEMSVMRSSLWPGLLQAAATNLARQQDRIRLFEMGSSFHGTLDAPEEIRRVAAIAIGSPAPEQWATKPVALDFFDIRSEVDAVLALADRRVPVTFAAETHGALQPGQSARIRLGDEHLGWIGKIHPNVARAFDIKPAAYVFELATDLLLASTAPVSEPVSKFPTVRRDIAVIVDKEIAAADLITAVKATSEALIQDVRVFDVYTGPGIEAGLKSVALGLILQETSRTLTDEDADAAMAAAVQKLQSDFAAVLRD